MPLYSTDGFINALESKGFQRDKVHHHMFWYYLDGKKTSLRTRTSHNEDKQFGGFLASQRRKQIGELTADQFRDFIACPFTGEQYKAHLLAAGLVVPTPEEVPAALPPTKPKRTAKRSKGK